MLLYNHMRKHKRNVLFLGPTGSGKTEIWRVLSEIYSNIRIIDCTRLSMEGWKGDYKIKNIFEDLSDEEAENTILVLDEFDKMCEPKHGTGGTDWGRAIQNELLKFIEGADIICNYKSEQRKIKYLTFVIICYNKDYQNALKNIHSILKSHIPFEYEILAIYNRSGNIQKEAESEFFEEIKKLKNTRSLLVTDAKNQYFCRSLAIKSINSKYTWFIDGDDSILKIPRKFKNLDYDVVCFNAKTSDGNEWCFGPNRKISNLSCDFIASTINFTLWNKWIKTDILKNYSATNKKIVSGEDSLYCIYSLLNARIKSSFSTPSAVRNAVKTYSS